MTRLKWRNAAVVLALVVGVLSVRMPRVRAEGAAELFDAQMLQRIDIDLHTADWTKLKQDFQSDDYYPADVTWNGIKAYNTGVRSRGAGSRSGVKPGLRLDFNRYASDQRYL